VPGLCARVRYRRAAMGVWYCVACVLLVAAAAVAGSQKRVIARAWRRYGRMLTCATVAVSLACVVERRRQAPVGRLVVSFKSRVELAREHAVR
jgi:uncharacterized protein with PIN domain